MKIGYILALAAFSGLAACGGSGGDDGEGGGGGGVLSTGVLQDVIIPSAADLADVPAEVRTLVDDFAALNEGNEITVTTPSGVANYSGAWGFGLDDGDAVVVGDLNMQADFVGSGLTGTVSNLRGDDNGTPLTIANDLDVLAAITGSEIQGTVSGTVLLEGENYGIESSMDGAFGGPDADVALGTTMGQVTNPDSTVDSFSGYFAAEKQ